MGKTYIFQYLDCGYNVLTTNNGMVAAAWLSR